MESTVEEPISSEIEFVETGYGKNNVKLLSVDKSGNRHIVKEIKVCVELSLNSSEEYTKGDNSAVIATDSQKNTIFILARKHGVSTIEEFAVLLCRHFLSKYTHVPTVRVFIEEAPWERIRRKTGGHVHAFVWNRNAIRYCDVTQVRHELPLVSAGLKELRIMKTARSSFKNFLRDEYTTLEEADDRTLCAVIRSRWWYNRYQPVDYNHAWETVKSVIIDTFAGPPTKGVKSASVQATVYKAQLSALDHLPQVDKIEMTIANVHYNEVDYARFKDINLTNDRTLIYCPLDNPSGNIRATVRRKPVSKL